MFESQRKMYDNHKGLGEPVTPATPETVEEAQEKQKQIPRTCEYCRMGDGRKRECWIGVEQGKLQPLPWPEQETCEKWR